MKYLIKNTEHNQYFRKEYQSGLTSDIKEAAIYDDENIEDVESLRIVDKYDDLISIPAWKIIDEVSTTNFSITTGNIDPNWLENIPEPKLEVNSDEGKFKETLDSINSLLEYKNKKYGNAALEPLGIFEGKCKVGQRLDDKLARIKNSEKRLQKNDVADLIGYLTLVCVENGWNNFDEFKD